MGEKCGSLLSALLFGFIVALSTPTGLIDLLIVHLHNMCFSSVLCCGVLWAPIPLTAHYWYPQHSAAKYHSLRRTAIRTAYSNTWLLGLKWCQSNRVEEHVQKLKTIVDVYKQQNQKQVWSIAV